MAVYVATNIYKPELDFFLFVYEGRTRKVFDMNTIQNIAVMHKFVCFHDALRHCYENVDSLMSEYDIKRLIKTSITVPHTTCMEQLTRSDNHV